MGSDSGIPAPGLALPPQPQQQKPPEEPKTWWGRLETWKKTLGVFVGIMGLGAGAHAFHESLATDEEVHAAMESVSSAATSTLEDLERDMDDLEDRHSKLLEDVQENATAAKAQAKDNGTRLDMLIWMQQIQGTRRPREREELRERINSARASLPPSEDPLAGVGNY